jgi:hypothetical protein
MSAARQKVQLELALRCGVRVKPGTQGQGTESWMMQGATEIRQHAGVGGAERRRYLLSRSPLISQRERGKPAAG